MRVFMANPLTRDARGYESRFSTNHLGDFQLAARLWPALQKAEGARVVAVSSRGSRGHTFGGVDFDDPNFERREYNPYVAYGQSKTANAFSRSRSMHWESVMACGHSPSTPAASSRRTSSAIYLPIRSRRLAMWTTRAAHHRSRAEHEDGGTGCSDQRLVRDKPQS
jgi:NAD(P)-dependent dehydrogenase (short-subunit alcohol dehydrogenase family)